MVSVSSNHPDRHPTIPTQQTDLHATVSEALKTIASHRAPTLSLTANMQTQLYLKLILGWSTADVCTLRIALFKAEYWVAHSRRISFI